MINYWAVGASWGGTEQQDKNFGKQGIGCWVGGIQPDQYVSALEMKVRDRIAIERKEVKAKLAFGFSNILAISSRQRSVEKMCIDVSNNRRYCSRLALKIDIKIGGDATVD